MSVYKIINDVDNKIYVGETMQSLDDRYKKHLENVKYGSTMLLHEHMRLLGIEHFRIEMVMYIPELEKAFKSTTNKIKKNALKRQLKYWEMYYIRLLGSYSRDHDKGLNHQYSVSDCYFGFLEEIVSGAEEMQHTIKWNSVYDHWMAFNNIAYHRMSSGNIE